MKGIRDIEIAKVDPVELDERDAFEAPRVEHARLSQSFDKNIEALSFFA